MLFSQQILENAMYSAICRWALWPDFLLKYEFKFLLYMINTK